MITLHHKQLLLLSDICLILVAVVWGSSYGVAKNSLQFYPVLGFLAIRFGLTSLFLMPFLLYSYNVNSQKIKDTFAVGLPLGLILLIIFICETFGVFYTSASNTAFLISLCIIVTPFMEWLILKNKPQAIVFVCAIISLFGTYLLTIQGNNFVDFQFNMGDGLIVLACVFRALMVIMTKKRLANKIISSLHLTAVQSIVVFIGCLILFLTSNFLTEKPLYIPTASNFWLSTVYLVIFCTIFAFFVQNWAVKIGTPSRASLLMGGEPVFGALFAVWLFGEQVSTIGWIGGGLITLSSIILILHS